MDMREEEVADVRQREPRPGEAGLERGDARGWPAVDEGGLWAFDKVRGDHLRPAEVPQVDQDRHVSAPSGVSGDEPGER
jgi:hypothetical protein